MKNILVTLLLFKSLTCFGQENISFIDPILPVPRFPGGDNDLTCYIENSLNYYYTNFCEKQGVIIVSFNVDTFGVVTNVNTNITRTYNNDRFVRNDEAENEIIRVFKLMPKWIPAQQERKKYLKQMSFLIRIPYTNFRCSDFKEPITICTDPDILADFKGANGKTQRDRIDNFINSRLKLINLRNADSGFVFIKCIVECNGSLSGFSVIRGLHYSLNEEALRVVKLMKNWHPAIKNNIPVRSVVVIPVKFNTN